MLELVLGLLLAAGAVYFVLRPILRPDTLDPDAGGDADEAGADPDDDLSPRAVALRALKEIEFDRATGKLSDADYDGLKGKYTAEALTALREESGAPSAVREPAPGAARGTPDHTTGAPRTAHRAQCPEHGPRPESDAEFCSMCGRRLVAPEAGEGFCARCGTPLEAEARFCGRCGVPVAA